MADLARVPRLHAATQLLQRNIPQAQLTAIMSAHAFGGTASSNKSSGDQQRARFALLTEAGFTRSEAAKLLDSQVLGRDSGRCPDDCLGGEEMTGRHLSDGGQTLVETSRLFRSPGEWKTIEYRYKMVAGRWVFQKRSGPTR
jgi:hypothetical protein